MPIIPAKVSEALRAAKIPQVDIAYIPGKAVHAFAVSGEAWLTRDDVLLFLGQRTAHVVKFLYYIGEENNRDVVPVGFDFIGFQLNEERAEQVRAMAAKVTP